MILVTTNRICLRAGSHKWYQSITGVIRLLWPYFLKPTVRKHLDAYIRTIVVLTGGKLTGFYFRHLLYAIYNSVLTHLRQGKKVCFSPPGDVNHGPVLTR
jgi:hypothetical protein